MQTSSAIDDSNLRELVENAVLRDETAPLLQLLFAATAAANQPPDSSAQQQPQQPAVAGPPPPAPPQPDVRATVLQPMQQVLQAVAAEQDKVIHEICTSNAMDIASCVADLDYMQAGVGQLRELLATGNSALQAGGRALVDSAHALSELVAVQANVASGVAVVGAAKRLLRLCLQVGALLDERRLYQAWQLIEQIKTVHLGSLLSQLTTSSSESLVASGASATGGSTTGVGSSRAAGGNGGAGAGLSVRKRASSSANAGGAGSAADGSGATGSNAGASLANVISLRALFEALISELVAAVESLALAEFNDWLVHVRSSARTIGLRAVRKAAIARQLEEDLARERLRLDAQLSTGDKALGSLSSALAKAPFRVDLLSDHAPPGASSRAGRRRAAPASAAATGTTANGGTVSSGTAPYLARLAPEAGMSGEEELAALYPGAPHLAIAELLGRWRKQRRATGAPAAGTAAQQPAGQRAPGNDAAGSGMGTIDAIGSLLVGQSDASVSLLAGVEMRGLHRCVHMHEVLGRGQRLREYYHEQRRLQVVVDLSPPHTPFMESYQGYLAQVVGFFVVEVEVQRLAPSLASPPALAVLWEGAAAYLQAVLEAALCGPRNRAPSNTTAPAPTQTDPVHRRGQSGSGPMGGWLGAGDDPAALAPMLVLVKDFVLLVCDALEELGCSTAPLQGVLAAAGLRYHELLSSAAARAVTSALASDPMAAGVDVRTDSQAQEWFVTLGLPSRLDGAAAAGANGTHTGAAGPAAGVGSAGAQGAQLRAGALPKRAPFTACVPELLRAVRAFVGDSVPFLAGLLRPWEVAAAALHQRDKLMAKVVVEALLGRVAAAAAAGAVGTLMWLVADAWALATAGPVLDLYTCGQAAPKAEQQELASAGAQVMAALASAAAAGGTNTAGSQPSGPLDTESDAARKARGVARFTEALMGSGAGSGSVLGVTTAALRGVQVAAERALLKLVSVHVEGIVGDGLRHATWTPSAPLPPGPSAWVESLLRYMQETLSAAGAVLPAASFAFLLRTTLKSVALTLLRLFTPDGIKSFNLFAIEKLAADVAAVQAFAGRASAAPGGPSAGGAAVSGSMPLGNSLTDEFVEPAQLCRLLLSSTLEEVLVPELRRQRYPNLTDHTIVLALDKYKEILKVGKEKTRFPTRKAVETIAKQLRGQMVSGSAAAVLTDF